MTIKEAAALHGVSTQAIYQRITKAGKKTRDIANPKTGELSEAGEALIASFFASTQPTAESVPAPACKRCKELEADNAALQAENKALQTRLEEAQADKDRLFSLLAQAQQTAQALTVARITAGDDQQRGGILSKLREKWGKK